LARWRISPHFRWDP